MFDWLQKKDWQSSSAHLLLLSKFRNGDSPERYREADYWETVLKETPAKAIEQFIKDGILEPAGLQELMNYRFKSSDLVLMLKERGLKTSGRKEELIYRLLNNDTSAMREITKGLDLYRCAEEGMQLVEKYLDDEKSRKKAVEHEVLKSLEKKAYSEAASIVAQYEATQVFPRGLGIDWKNYDITSDVGLLKTIFESTPAILKGIEENRLKQFRLASGMMQLWGTNTARHWLPVGLETGVHLDSDAACRMLIFFASYLRNMKNYREAGAKSVEVLGVNDENTCPQCRMIIGRKYRLEDVPELPYNKCTCVIGCRCTIVTNEF